MKPIVETPVCCPKCGDVPTPKNNEQPREKLLWSIFCNCSNDIEILIGNKRSEVIEKWNRAAKKEKGRLSLLGRQTFPKGIRRV